jgi:hypothetical protein
MQLGERELNAAITFAVWSLQSSADLDCDSHVQYVTVWLPMHKPLLINILKLDAAANIYDFNCNASSQLFFHSVNTKSISTSDHNSYRLVKWFLSYYLELTQKFSEPLCTVQ